jgi:hypothetical protein
MSDRSTLPAGGPSREDPSRGDEPPAERAERNDAPSSARAADRARHDPGRPGSPEPGERRPVPFSWPGVALLAGAGLIAIVVTFGIFLPAIGEIGASAARDPRNLPARISICGRDWTKDALNRELSRDEVYARTEAEPIVVSTGPFAACPPEVSAAGGDAGGMATVVFVQTGEDRFVPYELVGGP